jgi:hypothetical protein
MVDIYVVHCDLDSFEKTVANGVNKEGLNVSDDKLLEQIKEKYKEGKVFLWGFSKNHSETWKEMKKDDILLFYHNNKIVGFARIAFKYPFTYEDDYQLNEAIKVSNTSWGQSHRKDKSRELLVFLDKTKEIDVSIEEFNKATKIQMGKIKGIKKLSENKPLIFNLIREILMKDMTIE